MRAGMSDWRLDVDREAESVEQLRPQLPLLRIAAPDQHEARRMADAQALALDDIHARSRDVEQEIDEMILEQIHLVDIEKSAIGVRQQPRLERISRRS